MLGEISYPLYVLHYPLMYAAVSVLSKAHVPTAWLVPACLLAMALLALAVSRCYDLPVRRWLARKPWQTRGAVLPA